MYRTIVEERSRNIVVMDIFSKLIEERIIFIDDVITPDLANQVIAQMLYLDSTSHDEINIYINSPGGDVYAGLAIYDIGALIKSPIKTVCIGLAASMGAILMLMGKTRCATKHSRMMLHQPSGGVIGTADDIEVVNAEIQKVKKELYDIVESKTNISNSSQLFQKDYWLTTEEALKHNIITTIL